MFVLGGQDFSVAPNPLYPGYCPPSPAPGVPPPPCPPFVPASTFFNDVWRSSDGVHWEETAAHAPWQPRAGLSAIVFKGWIYVLGGSLGDDAAIGGTGRLLFNDVWRSRDGAAWELVTPAAGWSPRPGHQCQVLFETFLCFGGFGFPTNPFVPAHPRYLWASRDGASWTQVSDAPWSAGGPEGVKYDFDSLVVRGDGLEGLM
ncbi:MAG: hypothetical protein AB7N65_24965 [Vicinamibacterales bacterium]